MVRFTVEHNDRDGDDIVFVRSYRDLRRAAQDWKTFSNDVLGRIQIPAEDKTRSFRQCPIEFDPPQHGAYRAVVQGMFNKPFDKDYVAGIENLVGRRVREAQRQGQIEIVQDFALPLQSLALTHLLGMPESEADIWVTWGLHVFRSKAGDDLNRADALNTYLASRLDRAVAEWPDSLFAHLGRVSFEGRPLTHDEMMGFAHLVFAGGRGTVIRLVAGGVALLAQHPDAMTRIRDDPALAATATEELVRVLSPLTFLGRVCPGGSELGDIPVAPGQRIALHFADANRDPEVFADPDSLIIDRRPNPHVGFGSGPHSCPGSAHARLLSRTVLQTISTTVQTLEVAGQGADFTRRFEELEVRFG